MVFNRLRKLIHAEIRRTALDIYKVKEVAASKLTCKLVPERPGAETELDEVPLRIFNLEGTGINGITVVPRVGTLALVGFIGGSTSRPVIVDVLEWAEIIIYRADKTVFKIDAAGTIWAGNETGTFEPAVLGDQLYTYLNVTLRNWLFAQLAVMPPAPPDFRAERVKIT